MWSVPLIIGVAVAGGVGLLATGIVIAIKFERRRYRHFVRPHGLNRGLSFYHRPKLSANQENYSHVTLPTTLLRRSVHLPYDLIPTYHSNETTVLDDSRENTATRSRRRSFPEPQLYVPKTRKPRKLRKLLVLDQSQKAPLSAIAEFAESRGCTPPAEPSTTDEAMIKPGISDGDTSGLNRSSMQWPLQNRQLSATSSAPTEVTSIAARTSVLMRMVGGTCKPSGDLHILSVPRSTSLNSTASSAPEDPLPPLPTTTSHRHSRVHDLRSRGSSASLETVGSSVLGILFSSPSNVGTKSSGTQLEPGLDSSGFDFGLNRKLSTPRLQIPPAKQTIHGLCAGKSSIRSLHPSVHTSEASFEQPRLPAIIKDGPCLDDRGDALKTIDASNWEIPFPLRVNKTRRRKSEFQRHSMYERSKILEWRAASDSYISKSMHEASLYSRQTPTRPASVATADPLQWDSPGNLKTNRHSLSSLNGPKRGHRRQNCVRITNLPSLAPIAKQIKVDAMPQVQEEQQLSLYPLLLEPEHSASTAVEVVNINPILKEPSSFLEIKASTTSPLPLKPYPILTPSSAPRRQQQVQRQSSTSSGTPRPDSDIFNPIHIPITASSHYDDFSPRQWPFSPASINNLRFSNTPPSAHVSESQPAESPMLPSPAFNSSTLYPRKSLVKGPRNPRGFNQNFRPFHGSPLQHKHGNSYIVSKHADLGNGDVDLRRSVMMLRSMNSEGRLLDHQSSKIYCDVGSTGIENVSMESLRLLTPPFNKRVSGLRSSSCSSSTMALSPSMDRQARVSSSLASGRPTNVHRSRMNTAQPVQCSPPNRSESPSSKSPDAVSIWEDASVRDDSPEPEALPSRPRQAQPRAVRRVSPVAQHVYRPAPSLPHRHHDHHQQQVHPPMRPKTPTRVHMHHFSDAENSNLVQRLERVVSNGQWDARRVGSGGPGASSGFGPSEPASEVGLGLRVGNTRLGEPEPVSGLALRC